VLTVDDYGAIRRARRDGKAIRQIAREFDHSRNTVRKILKHPEPGPAPATRDRFAPMLGPVRPILDQILRDDEDAPPKQRCPFGKRVKSVRLVPGWAGGQWAFGWRTDLPMVDTARWRDEAGPVGRW
jgi:hypothetical protein